MLRHLDIQNFVIVEALSIDFTHGLSILTGETGAGKSLWVDALSLALGQRGETQWIRAGAERAEITATFDIQNQPHVLAWLQEASLDQEHECIIRRILSHQGNTRCTINGTPVPLQQVRALAQLLVQIYSQHHQHALFQSEQQRLCLDAFAANQSLLKKLNGLFQEWQQIQQQIQRYSEQPEHKHQKIEFLRYQLHELEALDLKPGEWEQLSCQHQKIHHAKTIMQQLNQALELTAEHEEHSARYLIEQALHHLNDIKIEDGQLTAIRELLYSATIHLNEAIHEIEAYRDSIDLNEYHLAEMESRLTAIHDLSRKHHCAPEHLADIQQSLTHQLQELLQTEEKLAILQQQKNHIESLYHPLADTLSKKRQEASMSLEKAMTQSMQEMNMLGAAFQVAFEACQEKVTAFGHEKIQFLIQTNAGQGFQPLQKVASGGELSRISLALHVLTAQQGQMPTLIFDEADVGISGKTAAIVGKLLRTLGEKTQVLCITHLPQVACHADQHYQVTKETQEQQTHTVIKHLSREERVVEIARLLGGATITKQSLAHALELLETA